MDKDIKPKNAKKATLPQQEATEKKVAAIKLTKS